MAWQCDIMQTRAWIVQMAENIAYDVFRQLEFKGQTS